MSDIPDNAPAPRLCIITKWPDFEGYGFNLHAEKSKPGQYIGKVDAASPAELAGLLEGDRIVEVNGVNIANENHKQVVQRIKAVSNETRLLVLDAEADKYYKAKNIVVRGGQSNVVTKSSVRAPPSPATPEPPATNGHHQDDADARSVSSAASSSAASEASTQPQSPMSTSPTPPPSLDNTSSNTAKSTPTPTRTPRPRHQSHHHHHLLLFLFSSQHPRPHACSVSGLQQCLQLERPEPEHVRGRDAGDAGPQEEGRPSQGHLRPAEKIRDHPEHVGDTSPPALLLQGA
nr:Na(+)/H(+) exchange regulatory cofactor NHE-RF1-like isoform X1 [Penaeus vannamei]